MFREQTRKELCELAEGDRLPAMVEVRDSYGHKLRVIIQDGNICLSVVSKDGNRLVRAGVEFAGPGGGDIHRPLTKEALRLLALAMEVEGDLGAGR